jgi:uncharacterized repeat protein (TIGR03803 family)
MKRMACAVFVLCAMAAIALPGQTFTTLLSFDLENGKFPNGLVQATNGDLYGTTEMGGASGDGTVFKITPSGTLTTLHESSRSHRARMEDAFQRRLPGQGMPARYRNPPRRFGRFWFLGALPSLRHDQLLNIGWKIAYPSRHGGGRRQCPPGHCALAASATHGFGVCGAGGRWLLRREMNYRGRGIRQMPASPERG